MIRAIKKRGGSAVFFDASKLNRWGEWAAGIGVDWSGVVLEATRKCYDGCTTDELHQALIAACVDRETTAHLKMAGRLYIGAVYKQAFGNWREIPSVQSMYHKMSELGLWAKMDYSEEELGHCNKFINHELDLQATLTETKQIIDKYAISDRVAKKVYETPQFVYMRMALGTMEKMPKDRRMQDVSKLYTLLSQKKINPPTPFSLNLGTEKKQYASCCVFTTEDSAASLAAADHIAYMMTCASAGIGGHIKTRSRGDKVRGGAIQHMGKLPYYKVQQAVVGANLQACYSEDTEVLTDSGFKLFKNLEASDMVAQVHQNQRVSFIHPIERQTYDYTGSMVEFTSGRNMGVNLLVTSNHRMTFLRVKKHKKEQNSVRKMKTDVTAGWRRKNENYLVSAELLNEEAETFTPSRQVEVIFGGQAIGQNDTLCPFTRLEIAFQADGVTKPSGNFAYVFRFTKERKIARLKAILDECGIDYSESLQKTGVTSIYAKVGTELKKDFSHINLAHRSSVWFKDFLKEAALWDGSVKVDSSMDCVTLCSTTRQVIDFFQSAAALCGAYSALSVEHNAGCKDTYKLYVSFARNSQTGRALNKTRVTYSGQVYCVTVPTGNIIVRRRGRTAVCGNSRGGANTMHFNVLDPEIFDLLKLKNVQTIADKRIKDIDYSVGYNEEFARRVAANTSWMLVSYGDAPRLYEAMYSGDSDAFRKEYADVENDPLIKKEIVSAREIAITFLTEAVETGRLYEHNTSELNRHTPFKDKIYSSNLCVAPETLVLTDKGHEVISTLKDQTVNVWNGCEWSETTVRQTSHGSELLTVRLSDGKELDCTADHKFYKAVGYSGESKEVPASMLAPGDKLIKLDTPVIEGELELSKAYENGFYSGDGCNVNGHARVYLYGDKRSLREMFTDTYTETVQDDRTYFYVRGLQEKFFVPGAEYSVDSRLKWLAGLLDADGCVARSGLSQTLQIASTEPFFLTGVQLMLQTLGVQSKVVYHSEAGMKLLPANDGTGSKKLYYCKAANRLLITATGIVKLRRLGLKVHRLSITDHIPDGERSHFVKVVSVESQGRVDATFCFTEPKRHMGVFNGILTGQCQEISLPTKGYGSVAELYKEEEGVGKPEIGLCSLAAIAAGLVTAEEYEEVAYYASLMIDNVIDIMEYPFPQLKVTAQARRSIGVGITNLAFAMAKEGLKYSSLEGKRYIHRLAERHSFWLHKASVRLAKERGQCEWFDKTRYSDGWLPIDTANREIRRIVGQDLLCGWEDVRKEIAQYGVRFSVLEAHMPCESSAVAGGHTNGLYPIRAYKVVKTSGTNKNLFIAPELDTLASSYELAWEIPTNDMIDVYAIVQCFTGQAISADLYIKYDKEGKRELSVKVLLQEWLRRVKLGMKSRYYLNSSTGVDLLIEEPEPVCDSCSL